MSILILSSSCYDSVVMGVFIAIEGGDGSGKATQAIELEIHALKKNYNVLRVGFPRYGEPSAEFIEHYLNGKYGPAGSVHPELASMLYAVDRYAASEQIRKHLRKPHSLVISDRYVASNLAHQGTKCEKRAERLEFYERVLELEYEVLDLPKPDLNIMLLVPPTVAQDNIDHKAPRTYTKDIRDIHERDAEHLQKANANYRELVKLYPDRFTAVACMEQGSHKMRPVADISEDIWNVVLPLLHNSR